MKAKSRAWTSEQLQSIVTVNQLESALGECIGGDDKILMDLVVYDKILNLNAGTGSTFQDVCRCIIFYEAVVTHFNVIHSQTESLKRGSGAEFYVTCLRPAVRITWELLVRSEQVKDKKIRRSDFSNQAAIKFLGLGRRIMKFPFWFAEYDDLKSYMSRLLVFILEHDATPNRHRSSNPTTAMVDAFLTHQKGTSGAMNAESEDKNNNPPKDEFLLENDNQVQLSQFPIVGFDGIENGSDMDRIVTFDEALPFFTSLRLVNGKLTLNHMERIIFANLPFIGMHIMKAIRRYAFISFFLCKN